MKKIFLVIFCLLIVSYIVDLRNRNESLMIDNEMLTYMNMELENKINKLTVKKHIIKEEPKRIKKIKEEPKRIKKIKEEPTHIPEIKKEPIINDVIETPDNNTTINDTIN